MASAYNAQFTEDEFQHFRHISGLKREQKLSFPFASLGEFSSNLAGSLFAS